MDVEVRAVFSHPRPRDLTVSLINPAGTEVVLFDGATAYPHYDQDSYLELDGPVLGFSGDESVNGARTLIARDRVPGQDGQLTNWALTITSRWD